MNDKQLDARGFSRRSNAGSLWHSLELHANAAARQKELFVIDGATHMDLYDGKGVNTAMGKLSPFFKQYL